jgi:hypothetical protein
MVCWRYAHTFFTAAFAYTLCSAAHAADQAPMPYEIDFAEKLVQLDAMMFVTDRVCLLKKQPLGSIYLTAQNKVGLPTKASDALLEERYHEFHKDSTYENLIVSTLNTYGQGHPRFDCGDLGNHFSDLSGLQGNEAIHQKIAFLLEEAPNHGHLPERTAGASAPESGALNSGELKEMPKVGDAVPPESTSPNLNTKAPMTAEPSSAPSTLERAKVQWLVETQNYTGGAFIKDF